MEVLRICRGGLRRILKKLRKCWFPHVPAAKLPKRSRRSKQKLKDEVDDEVILQSSAKLEDEGLSSVPLRERITVQSSKDLS